MKNVLYFLTHVCRYWILLDKSEEFLENGHPVVKQ